MGLGSVDYRVFVVTLLLLGVSCVFQILGLVTPGWIVMTFKNQTDHWYVGTGLWNVYFCHGDECMSIPVLGHSGLIKEYYDGYSAAKSEYLEQQIETIFAVVLLGIAMTVGTVQCFTRDAEKYPCQLRAIGSLVLISGMVALIAVCRLTIDIDVEKDTIAPFEATLGRDEQFGFPYSQLLTGVGSGLAVLAAISAFVLSCRQAPPRAAVTDGQRVDMEPVQGMWPNDRARLSNSYY